MKQTIYIDILILINIYIGFFLFSATKRLLNISIKKWKLLVSCLLCGITSLMIFVEMSPAELVISKVLCLFLICTPSFYNGNFKFYFKAVFTFFLVNIVFGGAMFLLWYFVTPPSMSFQNGVVYFNISAIMLAIFTVICYIIICIFSHFFQKKTEISHKYTVKITNNGNQAIFTAMLDSGNKLCDIFTGLPIILCAKKSLKTLIPQRLFDYITSPDTLADDSNLQQYFIENRIRIIPVSSVCGNSGLFAFSPQEIILTKGTKSSAVKALVAISEQSFCDGEFDCIFGTNLIDTNLL